jgi:hypothetical protein
MAIRSAVGDLAPAFLAALSFSHILLPTGRTVGLVRDHCSQKGVQVRHYLVIIGSVL